MLGFELCGTYSLSRKNSHGFTARAPLTTPSSLLAHLETKEGQYGIKQARRALSYVMPNSASPRETATAMLLCLPYALGGYRLENPSLNYQIPLDKQARKIANKRFYVCDLYWPEAKLDVEYESDCFHTGSERIASDSKRRNALSFKGITVVSITRKQMNNYVEFDKVAHIIAHHIGKRIRPRSASFDTRQLELRATVLGNGCFGPSRTPSDTLPTA